MAVMKIQYLSNGFCISHPLSDNNCKKMECKDCISCENFLTSREFIPFHKKRYENISKEIEKYKENNNVSQIWIEKQKKLRDDLYYKIIRPLEGGK